MVYEALEISVCEVPCYLNLWLEADTLHRSTTTLLELAVSPFTVYSYLMQLHMYDSRIGMPPLTAFLPWHASAPLQWGWNLGPNDLPSTNRLLNFAISPITLWLLSQALRNVIETQANIFQTIEQPAFNTFAEFHRVDSSPAPLVLTPVIYLRDSLLSFLGWSAKYNVDESGGVSLQTPNTTKEPVKLWRPLSNLVPDFLAERLQCLFMQIALLPIESLLLRSIAAAYSQSPYGAGQMALSGLSSTAALARVYAPLGGGPFGVMLDQGAAAGSGMGLIGPYASKIGLCIACQVAIDLTIWGGVYLRTRQIGINRFYWGQT